MCTYGISVYLDMHTVAIVDTKKVSSLVKCPFFKYMQEWYIYLGVVYILGLGKAVLFREMSSVQGCPYRGVPLYMFIICTVYT